MPCENQVGVKNLVLSFRDCNSGNTISAIAHTLAEDSNFSWNSCPFTKTLISGNRTRISKTAAQVNISVIPDKSVPSSYYTGCAEVDVSAEFYSGKLITGTAGSVVDASDMNEETVAMQIRFDELDEMRI